MKYNIDDFEKVVNGQETIKTMCDTYGVSKKTFIRAMNRKGYHIKKTKVRIITQNKTKVVSSISDCAYELKVSDETVRDCLKGKRIKLFEEMGIKIEVVR